MKKKNGDIASLFRKHEAKKNTSSSPPQVSVVDEAPIKEEELPPFVSAKEMSTEEEPPSPIYNVNSLEQDPGLRVPILSYDVNDQDAARRGHILKGGMAATTCFIMSGFALNQLNQTLQIMPPTPSSKGCRRT